MGGVRGGLGVDEEHFQKLDEFDNEDDSMIVEVAEFPDEFEGKDSNI